MSFLKKLFGLGAGSDGDGGKTDDGSIEHEGYSIVSTPMPEGGQFRLAGVISKEVDGEVKEHQLIRADLFPSKDDCTAACYRKAKQVIAEQGDRIFR